LPNFLFYVFIYLRLRDFFIFLDVLLPPILVPFAITCDDPVDVAVDSVDPGCAVDVDVDVAADDPGAVDSVAVDDPVDDPGCVADDPGCAVDDPVDVAGAGAGAVNNSGDVAVDNPGAVGITGA
jgi:hypothetical protein